MTVLTLQVGRVTMHVVFTSAAGFCVPFLTSTSAGDSNAHLLVAGNAVNVITNILTNHWYHWVYVVEATTALARELVLRKVLRIINHP